MALLLNLVNVGVAILAIVAAIYLMRNAILTAGQLRKAILITNLGFVIIIIEHFVIAYLRRTGVPPESSLWFIPLPLYTIAIILLIIGGYSLNRVLKNASKEG